MVFVNRRDAGRQLGPLLEPWARADPIVVAVPRGGVPVGFEVARRLGAPLDVLAVRKIGAPQNPEFGVGAIAEDGTAVLDRTSIQEVGMTDELLSEIVEREASELRRRVERYRAGREPLDVRGRVVIVVDDGLATGLTDLAAVRALRARGASSVVVAVPVGSQEAVDMLRTEADEVVCQSIPKRLRGVGAHYEDFAPVSDEEVVALLAGPETRASAGREVLLDVGGIVLRGDLTRPAGAGGLVIFAHGSGSSRRSPRNRAVARRLQEAGLATLLFDLLTPDEEQRRDLVFDIALLARRLEAVTRWAITAPETAGLPIGYFGASTGAGAAVRAAAAAGTVVRAVVSRGGRPDLAADRLAFVTAPTLLVVGSRDPEVLELNRRAAAMLRCPHELEVVDGASHLFEEPGTLEAVADLATEWFAKNLDHERRPLAAAR